MKFYMIRNVQSGKWCFAGLREGKAGGKTWATLAHAKSAISNQGSRFFRNKYEIVVFEGTAIETIPYPSDK